MSKSYYLLTAFGQDRPGLVARVTQIVFQRGGNVEDASMTRLGGEFSMMLVVGLPSPEAGYRLLKDLPSLQRTLQLTLSGKSISSSLAHAKHQAQATHMISIYGTDRPGIVFKAAQALAQDRINITDLNTRCLEQKGKPLYVMLVEVQIPSRAKAASVGRKLKKLSRALRLSMTLQDIDPVAL